MSIEYYKILWICIDKSIELNIIGFKEVVALSFGSRLRERREELGLKQNELGKLLGVTGSAIGNYENGISSPKAEILYQVFDVLKCDANFLFQDEMKELETDDLTVPEIKMVKKYRSLDDHGKKFIDVALEHEVSRVDQLNANIIPFPNKRHLPKSIQPVSAGRGAYLGPEEMETIDVIENDLTLRASFCVPVSGDSMEPLYHDGDILLVEGCEEIPAGRVGVFTVDGDGYVKKMGKGELISLNPEYPPVPMVENETWCNGLVIGVLDPAWIADK